jgi:hypothetical protein
MLSAPSRFFDAHARYSFFARRVAIPGKPWGPNIPVEEKRKKLSVRRQCTATRNFFSMPKIPLLLVSFSTLRLKTVLPAGVGSECSREPHQPFKLRGRNRSGQFSPGVRQAHCDAHNRVALTH